MGDEDPEFEALLAEYLRAVKSGSPPTREQFLRDHPGHTMRLEAFFNDVDQNERLTGPLKELSEAAPISLGHHPFSGYELVELIARGGMGVVYKARQQNPSRIVALKGILSGRLSSDEDIHRFRHETQAVAALDHPNIVPIYEVGEREGHHFFTMRLIEGGSLEKHLESLREKPRDAVALVVKVARAIHYAHQRGIIHRDLKPANILIDERGEPHLTDFGLAKRVEGGDTLTETNVGIGTPEYMAPEQADPGAGRPTVRVDVYSLGVILYELLTGRTPIHGRTSFETVNLKLKTDPESPRTHNPGINKDLAAVCLTSIERNPERRYSSALALAEDLERWLEGKPVRARSVGPIARVWRWSRRKPATAVLLLAGLLLFGGTALTAAFRMAERSARLEETQRGNVYVARLVANLVLHRLQEWSLGMAEASRDERLVQGLVDWNARAKGKNAAEIKALLATPEGRRLQEHCARIHERYRDPSVVNLQIMDAAGNMVARTPAVAILGRNFKERDYFRGTLGHAAWAGTARAVHVSSVYRSQADDLYKFDVCAPVVAPSGEVLGVISIAVSTDPTLGISDLRDEKRTAVLVAPWDTRRGDGDPAPTLADPEYLILLHPALQRRDPAVGVGGSTLRSLGRRRCEAEFSISHVDEALSREDAYRDPLAAVDPKYSGRWLAGFAPVGNTGMVVIVQQREE